MSLPLSLPPLPLSLSLPLSLPSSGVRVSDGGGRWFLRTPSVVSAETMADLPRPSCSGHARHQRSPTVSQPGKRIISADRRASSRAALWARAPESGGWVGCCPSSRKPCAFEGCGFSLTFSTSVVVQPCNLSTGDPASSRCWTARVGMAEFHADF